jgi:hypothetical protein
LRIARSEAVLGDVDGDVAAGVAGADDEDAVAGEVADVVVLAGVQLRAGELAGHRGDVRTPQMAVRDQHAVEHALVAAGGLHAPAGRSDRRRAGGLGGDGDDRGVAGDQVVVAVVPRVGLDVGPDLVAPREVRVVGGHREALERGRVARGDQVQRLVVGVPVAADPIGLLEALDLVAGLAQLLQGRQPGRAGTDHAVSGHPHSFAVFVENESAETFCSRPWHDDAASQR